MGCKFSSKKKKERFEYKDSVWKAQWFVYEGNDLIAYNDITCAAIEIAYQDYTVERS